MQINTYDRKGKEEEEGQLNHVTKSTKYLCSVIMLFFIKNLDK